MAASPYFYTMFSTYLAARTQLGISTLQVAISCKTNGPPICTLGFMIDPARINGGTRFRLCEASDFTAILDIINAAAVSYRGEIPAEHWQEPYMSAGQLGHEIEAKVVFWAYLRDQQIVGVMGRQSVGDVDLIRHAYVLPAYQGAGIGGKLLRLLRDQSARPILVGTWAAANDAIRFYERHGFVRVEPIRAQQLLRRYWDVSEAQASQSVVLEECR